MAEKVRVFNDCSLEFDPSLILRTLFEGREREFLKQIPTIPWGEDIEVMRLKVQKEEEYGTTNAATRWIIDTLESTLMVVASEREQTVRIFTDKKWSLIGEFPLRGGINLTIEDLDKQSSGSIFMQLKATELIGNIRKVGSNSQAL